MCSNIHLLCICFSISSITKFTILCCRRFTNTFSQLRVKHRKLTCAKKPDLLATFEREKFAWPVKPEQEEEEEGDAPSNVFLVEDEFLDDEDGVEAAEDYEGPEETADDGQWGGDERPVHRAQGEPSTTSTRIGRVSGEGITNLNIPFII